MRRSWERRDAMELAKSGPTAAAIEALDACLARDPNDVEVLEAILETMIRVKVPAERIDPYSQRWCEVRPESVDALKLRLVVFGKLFRPASELIPILERLLELDSGNYEKRAELASAYFVVGRYRDAIRESNALLEKSPLPRDGLRLGIARAESASGNYAAASAELDSLLSEDPQRRDALLLRGIVYQQMGDDARAVEVVRVRRLGVWRPRHGRRRRGLGHHEHRRRARRHEGPAHGEPRRSVLDMKPSNLGKMLRPLGTREEWSDEMLEGRV